MKIIKYSFIIVVVLILVFLLLDGRSKSATTIEKVDNCEEVDNSLKKCTCNNGIQLCEWKQGEGKG